MLMNAHTAQEGAPRLAVGSTKYRQLIARVELAARECRCHAVAVKLKYGDLVTSLARGRGLRNYGTSSDAAELLHA